MGILFRFHADFSINNHIDKIETILEKILVICSTKWHKFDKNINSPSIEFFMMTLEHVIILHLYQYF